MQCIGLAVEANRFDATALVNRGNALLLQEEFSAAKGAYQQAIQLDPQCTEARYNHALACKQLALSPDTSPEQQIIFLKEALEVSPIGAVCSFPTRRTAGF